VNFLTGFPVKLVGDLLTVLISTDQSFPSDWGLIKGSTFHGYILAYAMFFDQLSRQVTIYCQVVDVSSKLVKLFMRVFRISHQPDSSFHYRQEVDSFFHGSQDTIDKYLGQRTIRYRTVIQL